MTKTTSSRKGSFRPSVCLYRAKILENLAHTYSRTPVEILGRLIDNASYMQERTNCAAVGLPRPDGRKVLSIEEAWKELCEYERTSEYPDMCLITKKELESFMRQCRGVRV